MTMIDEAPPSRSAEDQVPDDERRRLLKWLGAAAVAVGGAAVTLAPPRPTQAQTQPGAPEHRPSAPAQFSAPGSAIERMQADLERALAKPVEQRRWVMAIDLRKCVGCSACTVACKAENQLPPGVVYRPVIEEEMGAYPNVSRRFVPRPCMQCDNPPCVPVCPVSATYKRPDGVVAIDYEACIGCRYCVTACPYSARTFDSGLSYTRGTPALQPYEQQANFEYGKRWDRSKGSPVGNVRKCTFCLHRLDAEMLPACVTTCIGGATYFGDANDPTGLVSEIIASPHVIRLKEELGTKPKVYYLL